MNKQQFIEFARDVSVGVAKELAICNGVTPAQVELWALGLK